jgi:hypothetical protein
MAEEAVAFAGHDVGQTVSALEGEEAFSGNPGANLQQFTF